MKKRWHVPTPIECLEACGMCLLPSNNLMHVSCAYSHWMPWSMRHVLTPIECLECSMWHAPTPIECLKCTMWHVPTPIECLTCSIWHVPTPIECVALALVFVLNKVGVSWCRMSIHYKALHDFVFLLKLQYKLYINLIFSITFVSFFPNLWMGPYTAVCTVWSPRIIGLWMGPNTAVCIVCSPHTWSLTGANTSVCMVWSPHNWSLRWGHTQRFVQSGANIIGLWVGLYTAVCTVWSPYNWSLSWALHSGLYSLEPT